MIPADVKANKPKRNKRSGGCNLKMFYYLQKLKNNVRKVCIFHLILLDILSILILSVRNKGRGGRVFAKQTKSVKRAKVICRQSLTLDWLQEFFLKFCTINGANSAWKLY